MPEPENQTVLYLLIACTGLVITAICLILRLSSKLSRLEKQLSRGPEHGERAEEAPPAAETSPGGAFEAFLEEDPARRELTKKEQFAAYRQWRHEKGLNWSNSGVSRDPESA